MIVAVHALTGAAIGRVCRNPGKALILGAASHLIADHLPHRALDPAPECLLAAAALGFVAVSQGSDSPEFAGAVGAVAPDLENVVARAARLPKERLLLPTHNRYHGRKTPGLGPQIILAAGCLALLCLPWHRRCEDAPESGISTR